MKVKRELFIYDEEDNTIVRFDKHDHLWHLEELDLTTDEMSDFVDIMVDLLKEVKE